jgi:hypothetical protein
MDTTRDTAIDTQRAPGQAFRKGDQVLLASGTYQGTLGSFLQLKTDVNWADIEERNGKIRSHPVAWLAHAEGIKHGQTDRQAA